MGSRKLLGIGIVAIIIGIVVIYGSSGEDTETRAPFEAPMEETTGLSGVVNIGLILPLTGDLATHGEENWEGSKLGVVDFNKHLEEIDAGWTLKMTSEDSATSPVIALEKLSALNAKGIGIIVGPETSSIIRNIKGYSDSNNMLLISCCSSDPAFAIHNDSVFSLVPDDSNHGTAFY